MTTIARTLAALTVTLSPAPADDGAIDVPAELSAFEDEQLREVDEAIANLQALILSTRREIEARRADLQDAEIGLERLHAIREALQAPSPGADPAPNSAPDPDPTPAAVIPGTLDAVLPASAVEERAWQGTLRIVSSEDGRLDLRHESGDSSGQVQAGALQADQVEIRVSSPGDAAVIARCLRADGKPVVTWPDLSILPDASPSEPNDRIDAIERTLHRLAEAVDRIDRRTSAPGPVSLPPPDAGAVTVKPPAEIPSAPVIPD